MNRFDPGSISDESRHAEPALQRMTTLQAPSTCTSGAPLCAASVPPPLLASASTVALAANLPLPGTLWRGGDRPRAPLLTTLSRAVFGYGCAGRCCRILSSATFLSRIFRQSCPTLETARIDCSYRFQTSTKYVRPCALKPKQPQPWFTAANPRPTAATAELGRGG